MGHRSLNAKQFINCFSPSEYGESWSDVSHSLHSEEDFDYEWPQLALNQDVESHGVREPVLVHRGFVVDGHHRVIAAARSSKEIPFENSSLPLYEHQVTNEMIQERRESLKRRKGGSEK